MKATLHVYGSIIRRKRQRRFIPRSFAMQQLAKLPAMAPPGKVMTVAFELNGQPFTALNGGPIFKFNETISLRVICQTQEEIDYYWERLFTGGDENAQQCGWPKDEYGVSWQIIPAALVAMLIDPNPASSDSVMEVILKTQKLNFDEPKRAEAR